MKLEELPKDILTYLPDHLLSIYDFYSLSSTSTLEMTRAFYSTWC